MVWDKRFMLPFHKQFWLEQTNIYSGKQNQTDLPPIPARVF